MEGQKITVVIRKRPLGKKELAKGDQDIVQVKDAATVILTEIKQKVDLTKFVEEHNFNFDLAFGELVTNDQLYISAVRPIIEAAFNRAKVTCFAYGQTGSGKTYTMLGDPDSQVPGLYVLASYDIFNMLQRPEYGHLTPTISFYEIYCGKLFDLLNERTPLTALEDNKGNVIIKGICEKKVTNVQQLMQIIQFGQSTRTTASNSANSESSRSHALLQINLKQGKHIYGKLSFIDLAGSERGADVQDQNKQTRVDGAEINKSLLALKECIRALDQNKNHTPFRGSKLTLVLKDSFTGNCRTVMIGNISPSNASSEHTLNTLRYADRVKELKKPPEQKTQMDSLSRELGLARCGNNVVRKAYRNPDSDDDDIDEQGMQGSLQKNNSTQQSNNSYQQQQHAQMNIPRTMSAQQKIGGKEPQLSDYIQNPMAPQNHPYMQYNLLNPQQQQQYQQLNNQNQNQNQNQHQNQNQQHQNQNNFRGSGLPQQQSTQSANNSFTQQNQYKLPQQQTQQPQPFMQPAQMQNQQQPNSFQQQQLFQNYNNPQQQLFNNPLQQRPGKQPFPNQNNNQLQNNSFTQQVQPVYNQSVGKQNTVPQPQIPQQQQLQQQTQQNYQQQYFQQPMQYASNQPLIQNNMLQNNGYNFNQDLEVDCDEQYPDTDLLQSLQDPEHELELQKIFNSHQETVQTILQLEDEIMVLHKEYIDDVVLMCKQDMMNLNQIESNSIHTHDYIREVKQSLLQKQSKVDQFLQKIQEYEVCLIKVFCILQYFYYKNRKMNYLMNIRKDRQKLEPTEKITTIYNIMTDKIQYQPPLLHDAIKLLHASPDPYLFSNSVYSPYQNRCAFQSPTFLTMQSPEFQESYHPFDNVDLNMMMSEKSVGPINYNQLIVRHTKKQQDGFKMFRLETDLMTPIKKKTVSGFVDTQKDRIAPIIYQKSSENQQRSSKGLRNLSIKVKEIVMEMKHTTYKDVAERLIKELIYEAKIEDGENTKDEQNIKRRVYDALNVMIASGILRKEGKRVSADYHAQGSKKAKKGQLDTFQQQLKTSKTQMIFKRNKVLDLFSKYVALSNLTERNKKQKLEEQVPLLFPLLVYWAKEKDVDVHRERNVVTLASKKIVEPIWDCEVILALNFHRKQLTPIRGIPKELICYFQERIGDQYKSIIEGQLQFEFSGLQKQVQKVIPRKIEQEVKVEENSQDIERNQSQNTTAEKPPSGPIFTQEMIKNMPSPKFSQLAQMEYGIPLKQDLEQTQSKQSNTR